MKSLLLAFIFLLLPVFALAQNSALQELKIGNIKVSYDEVVEADTDENGVNDRSSFYRENKLVFTAYDRDEDGENDLWLQYDDELYLTKALTDRGADGTPDEALHFDRDGNVTKTEKLGGSNWLWWLIVAAIAIAAFIAWKLGFIRRGIIKTNNE